MSAPDERLVCPVCGSDALTSWEDSCTGYYGVRWYHRGGQITPDYDAVYDETRAEDTTYRGELSCRNCCAQLSDTDLVPAGHRPQRHWTTPQRTRPLNSDAALDAIAALLHARVWQPTQDLETIADTLRRTGRVIGDPDEHAR